ncbi:MAG: YidC/Oxa1 family membrane protein insertase [Patescibacteria group bacterium]
MIEIFNFILVNPIINILVAIYKLLLVLHIPFPLGFSIIGLTVVIRLILYPLTHSQLKASKKMQELSPHISRLKDKHKNDAKTLQAETMKLYKEFGVNPAAGCLPLIIQIPVIWGLYSVLDKVVKLNSVDLLKYVNGVVLPPLKLTSAWDTYFFGIPLGDNPAKLFSIMPFIILVPVLTAVFQFMQSKMMMASKDKTAKQTDKKVLPAGKEVKKKDDFASVFQSQSLYIFPLMIGFFSYTFPIGLSLYWNTFSVFGIIQQYQISGWGALSDLWKRRKK